jgi:parvulin-like peptidyl-prolyl isomerase
LESEDPESAARGGDIGWVARGASSPQLEKAVFLLPVGKTSEPIFTGSGYDVIRVIERRTAKPLDYETFKKDLAAFLDGRAQAKKLRAYLKELREKAVIERHLPSSP